MKTDKELFQDIDRLEEQIAGQMDALDASRKELDKMIESNHPSRRALRKISATLDNTSARLRELCQALWFKIASLRRLLGGAQKTS